MNWKLILLTCLLSHCACGQLIVQHWQYKGNGFNKSITKTIKGDSAFIPFENINIPISVIDSLCDKAIIHNSLSSSCTNCIVKPNNATVEKKLIVYDTTNTFINEDFSYRLYSFLIGDYETFTEHNCTLFYYVKGIGVVAAFKEQIDYDHIFRNWDRYLLTRSTTVSGKSIESSKLLDGYVDDALDACGCPNPN
jgi:hypothetical protein